MTFPAGYVLRRATAADAEAAARVMNDAGEVDGAPREMTPEDVVNALPVFEVHVVEAPDGRLVGYFDIYVEDERSFIDAAVHPDARGRGIGAALLDAAEARSRERIGPDGPFVFRCGTASANDGARELLKRRGYTYIRSFFRMEGRLSERPPEPAWPDGLSGRLFRAGDEPTFYDVLTDAFRDHWDHRDEAYDAFSSHAFGQDFRPDASFLVFDGDEPAAGVLSSHRFGMGWIGSLGVRRAWRKRGLGFALLHAALGAFYDSGERRVGLGVDAESTTGATRLYERAGMHVAARFDTYERVESA